MSKIRFPAEWEEHDGTIMIWPERPGSWTYGAKYARPVFAEIICNISTAEKVYIATSKQGEASAREMLGKQIAEGKVELLQVKTDDCWARDMAPTFVKENGKLVGTDWEFNAWGGDFNGLYKDYANDDAFAEYACKKLNTGYKNAHPFVLEGGSIHSNGNGIIMTTEECLLSKGRNPDLTKEQIEHKLKEYLGAEKVIWLKRGIVGDETDGHVDNICAFVNTDTVVLAWSDEGEQGQICRENYGILSANGIKVIKLPMPEKPVTITQFDLDGFVFEEGEDTREVGEQLAASYVNFYICNAGVLVPQFGDKNDKKAVEILKEAFPDKKIIPIHATQLIVGGGNIHCLTQQIPK